jgi:hypothetical protein
MLHVKKHTGKSHCPELELWRKSECIDNPTLLGS